MRGLQLKSGPQLDGLLDGAGRGRRPCARAGAPSCPSELRNRIKVVLPLASSVLQAVCAQAGIASELVATRDDLESLIRVVAAAVSRRPSAARTAGGESWPATSCCGCSRGEVALRVLPGPPHVAGRAG